MVAGDRHVPLNQVQLRFGDGDAERWADRVRDMPASPGMLVGAAIHSVRAVPRTQMATVVAANAGRPLHAHLSEQPAENEACLAYYGLTPTAVLAAEGVLGPDTSVVHATHLTDPDTAALGAPARRPASARPPSGTSQTASVRPARSSRPDLRCRSVRTNTR